MKNRRKTSKEYLSNDNLIFFCDIFAAEYILKSILFLNV